MLEKIVNFYKSHKYVILWTLGYFIVTWAILRYMFDFNIFSRIRWWQLMHAHLRGFAGMVFGILILAAIPMYVATTIVIARTKAPLFSVKIPEGVKTFFINAFKQTPMEEETEQPAPVAEDVSTMNENTDDVPETATEPTAQPELIPAAVPSELRVAYARAREHISRTPTSAFDLGNVTKSKQQNSEPAETSVEEMPIPSDFDIEDTDNVIDTVPQFTDIDFDDDDTEIEIDDVKEISDTNIPVVEYLKSKSVPYTVDNDVVLTDKFAIVSHIDSDFWVADNDAWFAAGKTRKSPIELVKRVASEHNVQPVLYLAADNIMDIDTMITQWESDGIRVVTDLKKLK